MRKGELRIHAAADKYRIAKSTIHENVIRHGAPSRPAQRTARTQSEEQTVVDLVLQFAGQGVPLTTLHLCDAFEVLVSTLAPERQARMLFKSGRPTVKFCRAFRRRHVDKLRLARPLRQKSKRSAACNAKTLTSHFATLPALMEKYEFDARRVWNRDETGATPDKYVNGRSRLRRLL